MSSLIDRFANKYLEKSFQSKLKNSNNNQKTSKKNIHKPNTLTFKQQILQNNYRNSIDKNKTFIMRNSNNSSLPKKLTKINLIPNNKKPKKNGLKYNKSFERQVISSSDIDNYMNVKTIDTFNKQKKFFGKTEKYSNKNKNSSYILNTSIISQMNNEHSNSTKSLIINKNDYSYSNYYKTTEKRLIKNLDDKFKSLENDIIDTQYSNYIDNDEFIISSTNKDKISKTKINKNQIKLTNILVYNNIQNGNNVNKSMDNSNNNFKKYFNQKSLKYDDDENYLLNCSFENNKIDFNLVYTNDYVYTITDNDTLELEIKLVIERILELQNSYHLELYRLNLKNKTNKKIFNLLYENYRSIKKKIDLLHKIIEKKKEMKKKRVFLDSYKLSIDKEINATSINEIFLWQNKFFRNMMSNNNKNNKVKLQNLFKSIVFDKYYKIEDKLSDIENKVVCSMMKKYKYNRNNKIIRKNAKVQKSSLGLNYKKSQINEKGLSALRNGFTGYRNKHFLIPSSKSNLIGEVANKIVNGSYKKHNKITSLHLKENNRIIPSNNKYKFK